jgi:glutathione peroxidase
MKKLKRFSIVIMLLVLAFAGYVEIVNQNSNKMTYRQKILKAAYPALMWWTKRRGINAKSIAKEKITPPVSFYTLKSLSINGQEYDFAQVKGKKVLIVNTASNCGYTDQYDELQQLHEKFKEKLVILGFPSNDFKEQEKGTDEEIEQFCKVNYGVTFPLMKKSIVLKNDQQNSVFKWLTDPALNGWNGKQPSWNFGKYLINEGGMLTNYFDPSVSPLSEEVKKSIEKD